VLGVGLATSLLLDLVNQLCFDSRVGLSEVIDDIGC